jgi:hypothetical protein
VTQSVFAYAEAIERINEIMPDVVERELVKDGHQTNEGAVAATRRVMPNAWHAAEQYIAPPCDSRPTSPSWLACAASVNTRGVKRAVRALC